MRQRGLVHDAQSREPVLHFVRGERLAVVGHQRPRQPALLNRLREPVHEVLGVLRKVPLQVADEPRVVVDDRERDRRDVLAARHQHLLAAVMEVGVPEPVDVLVLVAAHLALVEPAFGAALVGGGLAADLAPLGQPD